MKILKSVDFDKDDSYGTYYELDEAINVDSFITIVRQFANDNDAVLSKCKCSSFNEDGSPLFSIFYSADEILEAKDFPNPFVTFTAEFVDKNTKDYKFSLLTSTNDKGLIYKVSKKKLQNELGSSSHKLSH